MITLAQIRRLINLKEVSDDAINAVLPGGRSMLRSRLGDKVYKLYSSDKLMIDTLLFEELQLAEMYYIVSLLPTSLLQVQNNGVLVDTSQWGEGRENYSSLDEIMKLKQTLVDQANMIVDSFLDEYQHRKAGINMRCL